MTLIRVAVAAVAAAAGFTGAAPAFAADSEVFGTYTFAADDGEQATWTLTPCADNPPGCVRVSETGNSKRAPWSGDAHWSVGSWIMFVQQPDAILCDNAAPEPGVNTYSWDGVGLSGSVSIISRGACGAKPASLSIPFRLKRMGGAPEQPPAGPPVATPLPAAGPAPAAGPTPPAGPAPAPAAPLAAESTAGAGAAPDVAPPAAASPSAG